MPLRDDDRTQKLAPLSAWGNSRCSLQALIDALWLLHTYSDAGTVSLLATGDI